MGRRVKHVHAKPDEYVKVHRHRPKGQDPEGGGLIPLIVIGGIVLLILRGC